MPSVLTHLVGLTLAGVLVAEPCGAKDLRDLYFGEALYHANQGHYFEALERLDTELGQVPRAEEARVARIEIRRDQDQRDQHGKIA